MIDVVALAILCTPQIAPETMSAIVRHESRINPYAININGAVRLTRQPVNVLEAIEVAERLEAAGYSFDAGLSQINSANVRHVGASWTSVFDACANLQLGARVLLDCYRGASTREHEPQYALAMALSCYNTGNHGAGFRNGYVANVYQAHRRDELCRRVQARGPRPPRCD